MITENQPKRFEPTLTRRQPAGAETSSQANAAPHTTDSPDESERESLSNTREDASQRNASAPVGGGYENLSQIGSDLAKVLQEEGYHPVILFGTNNSGKTSVLMSLFSTIANEPSLNTGLVLCDPILGTKTDVARALHREAENTFHIKTQAFLAGEKIPKTSTPLPFFIPVEFRPPNGPSVKLAFLESNGEWYRPLISDGSKLVDAERLYPELRGEIESFISGFQNGITFLYAAPVTQGEVYSASENVYDSKELGYASLAIKGVLQTYDRIRANGRSRDKHLMLLTKWDALSVRSANRAESIPATHHEVVEVCSKRYGQALSAFQGLNLDSNQRNINAYCAGMIHERGLIAVKHDDPVRGVIASYPVRLWTYLYQNALIDSGLDPVPPFPQPPGTSGIVRFFQKLLDRISG